MIRSCTVMFSTSASSSITLAELIVELVKDLLGDGNPAKVIEELDDQLRHLLDGL